MIAPAALALAADLYLCPEAYVGATPLRAAWHNVLCVAPDPPLKLPILDFELDPPKPTADELVSGLVWDVARVGVGAAADTWATAYCIHTNPRCAERNPLGFNAEARVAVKAASGVGVVLIAHEFRKRGHPNRAKWLTRAAFVVQVGFAVNNVIQARKR